MQEPNERKETIEITIFVCPKCDTDLVKETNLDAMTLYSYKCNVCGYRN